MNRPLDVRPGFPWALFWFWLRRILPIWGLIGLVIFLMQLAVSGIVHDNENVRVFLKFLDLLPAFVKTALGGEMLRVGNTAGLIVIGYQHPLVLFLYLLFAVGTPTILLTREIQSGAMELILSRAATKTQVYYCAALLTLGGMMALTLVMFLGTVVAVHIYDFGEPIPLDLFFRIAVNGSLVAGAAGGIALFAAGAFAGRNLAVSATVGFLVADYFLWIVAQWWPQLGFLKPLALFYYARGPKVARAWALDDMAVLGAILTIAVFLGGLIWKRRDLPL